MVDTEHLDRVERFANWLEEQRRRAGIMQKELAAASGISHSYYSKICHIGQIRRTYGDGSREVTAPRTMRCFEGAFALLEERLGVGIRQEGESVWQGSPIKSNGVEAPVNTKDKDELISAALVKMMKLSDDNLLLVAEIISKLA